MAPWPVAGLLHRLLEKRWVVAGTQKGFDAKMFVREPGRHPASRGPVEKADLEQVRLDDLFDRVFFFVDGGGDRTQTDRAAIKLLDDRPQQFGVPFVEAIAVDIHAVERVRRDLGGNASVVVNLGK